MMRDDGIPTATKGKVDLGPPPSLNFFDLNPPATPPKTAPADEPQFVAIAKEPKEDLKIYFEAGTLQLSDIASQHSEDTQKIFLNANTQEALERVKADKFHLEKQFSESKLMQTNGSIDIEEMVKEFNKNVKKTCFETHYGEIPGRKHVYGEPGDIFLGARNKVPEMKLFDPKNYIYSSLALADTTEMKTQPVKATDPYFSFHSAHVLNVPFGKIALATSNNRGKIYDSGTHVIHDPLFSFDKKNGFVSKNEIYIQHSNLHIVRVPPGKMVKITIANQPFFLFEREEPYVFDQPLFQIKEKDGSYLYNANDNVIQHGNLSIVRVPQGQLAKVWINNQPHLLESSDQPYVFNNPQFKLDSVYPFINATDTLIEHGTIKIVRVPKGKYAVAWINNQAQLLLPNDKPYIFNDALVRIEKQEENALYDISANVIQHGTLSVLRVPKGKIAKILINNTPFLLNARDEPYVFNEPLFTLVKNGSQNFFDQYSYLIEHQTIHLMTVPVGFIAKVWVENKPMVLHGRSEAYEFNTAQFAYVKNDKAAANHHLFPANSEVISHGNEHVVRVPPGKIAKVTVNNEPLLLEGKKDPYRYEGVFFQHIPNGQNNFFDATEEFIQHGNHKRVLPKQNNVAISYKAGALEVIKPRADGKPILIDDPSWEVETFLDTGMKTMIFPSEEAVTNLIPNAASKLKDHKVIVCTTRDSVAIAVKLAVAFSINNPAEAISKFKNKNNIIEHIERLATSDIISVVQTVTSSEYNNISSNLTSLDSKNKPESDATILGRIYNHLKSELGKYGIELSRFSIESSTPLDEKLAASMSTQAQDTAKTNSEKANLEAHYQIAKRRAEQDADIKNIKATQENAIIVSTAQAELDAARKNADKITTAATANKDSEVLKAQGEAQAAFIKAETALKIAEMDAKGKILQAEADRRKRELENQSEAELMRFKAEVYAGSPALVQIELAKIVVNALQTGLERMPTLTQLPGQDRAQLMQFMSQLMGPGIPANTFTASSFGLFAPAAAPKQALPEAPAPQRSSP